MARANDFFDSKVFSLFGGMPVDQESDIRETVGDREVPSDQGFGIAVRDPSKATNAGTVRDEMEEKRKRGKEISLEKYVELANPAPSRSKDMSQLNKISSMILMTNDADPHKGSQTKPNYSASSVY